MFECFPFCSAQKRLGSGVYCILCGSNNKFYIGSSSDMTSRWHGHISALRHNKHHSYYLQQCFNKYSVGNFLFIVIERCEKEQLIDKEQQWIDRMNSANNKIGFNSCPVAGNCEGLVKSESTKIKHAEAVARKLDKNKVLEIKKLLSAGKRNTEVAEMFGVTQCVIAQIKNGKMWKHIGGESNFNYGTRGSLNPAKKLNECDVLEIVKLFKNKCFTIRDIAKQYDVSIPAIEAIKYGRTWGHITGLRRPFSRKSHINLSEYDVRQIMELVQNSNLTIKNIAKMYGVGTSAIEGIKYGKTWRHITGK